MSPWVRMSNPLRTDRTDQADGCADGKVNVTAGQDAEQHAAGENQNVAVLQEQVGQVLCEDQTAIRQIGEEDKDDHQGDDHGVFFNKGNNF